MKELSIEEKAQRYDEAIKIAKDNYHYQSYPCFIRADVVFPELKEDENERLRKTTINFLKYFADKGYENAVECIDWLKNQDE